MQWQVEYAKPKRYQRLRRLDYGVGDADPERIPGNIERFIVHFAEVANELDPEDKYKAKGFIITSSLDNGHLHSYPFYADNPEDRDEEFVVSLYSPPLADIYTDLDEISDENRYDAATKRLECFVMGVVWETYRRVRASELWPPRWRHEQFRALYVPLDDFDRMQELN